MSDQINPHLFLQEHFKTLKANLRKELDSLSKLPADRDAYTTALFEKYRLKTLKIGAIEAAGATKKKIPK